MNRVVTDEELNNAWWDLGRISVRRGYTPEEVEKAYKNYDEMLEQNVYKTQEMIDIVKRIDELVEIGHGVLEKTGVFSEKVIKELKAMNVELEFTDSGTRWKFMQHSSYMGKAFKTTPPLEYL